ncbi:FAST kinase domain-containing protein 1, mitochondrial isoform X1 [Stegostoma tigrinum]|uniref:FAST kinase domain-containing protein 1, mitochondrial isoform X1 n=2 Tax=Stegostoma tigrinum TaxID=3053191 RepID=UPI00202AFA4E|nr:FAST kinase domain-containing protein 1, mitochondrial isoform X1 [Stegostoma tigrinum]XP_048391143.1 FAST kinase domain-containing protein 1, mitochondrial isoform X1 [Stegostoma tigrinum]XP_048391144.1 FAST kinase domain-containing protein 1, mitochondrial isoform X1 [Stegostoma tigrinum]XP_048391145.1 FAST kinase domain-containing protein 1, mitochondrial isoform X1 [Stegostoma tigrinum]XP_059503225.1 FAST kinase domain-containing protein 1, mitochondrial isoform X1 [Stegostoma tigrinum]
MLLIKMLHLKRTCCPLMNFCRPRAMGCDSLLDQLGNCANEDQIFDVVAKNKAKLSVEHVKHAIHLLWQFQKERPQMLRTIDIIRKHPQFMVLHAVAENKIDLMDDDTLVDMLYNALRLNVEPHDSMIQQFMVEASRRIERFNMAILSKFAVCLTDQHMYHSPLMGEITDIVHRKLEYIQDARILSSLMLSISGMISTNLRNCLIEKAEFLLDTRDPSQLNNSRRIVQFLRNIKFSYRPLLEKCNKIFLQNIKNLDADNISIILGVYQSLHFNNCDFRLAAKWRLTELVNAHSDPASFLRLFAALGPLSGPVVRERLESATLLMVDDFSPLQTLAVIETMEEMESRNPQLIQKVVTILYTQLDQYKPVDVARITKALLSLRCQNPELYAKLRQMLISYLHRSVIPYEVSMLTRVLSLLPSPRIDNLISARINAVLPQCNLSDLNAFAIAITKWVRNGSLYQPGIAAVYVKLLQKLNKCGLERLRKADCMDLLMEELKFISGEWFEEVLAEETMTTFERLIDQVTESNVAEFALFLTKTNCLHTDLLDQIASVTLKHINKIHYSAIYATLLPFTILNYDPPQAEEFFESSIQHIRPHLNLCDPHLLVLFGYSLALAGYFPDDLIKTIFSVDFLAKLDSQLDTLPDVLNMRIRLRLMELNRAVCLECPEFQTPWFHDRYCQQLLNKGNPSVSSTQQQIQEILEHVLGGSIYSKTSVFTPYYYLIDFECVLDKHQKPLPYVDQSIKLLSEKGKLSWEPDNKQLVPGAQRVAIDFLDSKAFCKNSPHMKGETIMKRRHLEILGYHVVQIPHFQWNSMELSTKDAWVEYLKQKIFTKES